MSNNSVPKSVLPFSAPLTVIDRAKRHGWTIKGIAEAAGIDRGQVVRAAKGKSVATEALAALARFVPLAGGPPPQS